MLEVHAILQRQRCNENITKKTGTLSDAYINNQYREYRFDEAKRIEKADGTIYYRIELEKMNVDLEVNINEDGIVIP